MSQPSSEILEAADRITREIDRVHATYHSLTPETACYVEGLKFAMESLGFVELDVEIEEEG